METFTAALTITKVVQTEAVEHRYPEQRKPATFSQSEVLSMTIRSTSLEALGRKIQAALEAELGEEEV